MDEDLRIALERADEHVVKLQDEIERTVDFVETVPVEVDMQRTQTLVDLNQKIADVNSLVNDQRIDIQQFLSTERKVLLDDIRQQKEEITAVVQEVPANFVIDAEGGLSRLVDRIFQRLLVLIVVLIAGIIGIVFVSNMLKKQKRDNTS